LITVNLCRDLKPENILLESADVNSLKIKVTDFGFASKYDEKVGLSQVLGSPLYMAPEIVKEEKYDSKVDIWSIGVIAYVLLTGTAPFNARTKEDIFKKILHREDLFDTAIWKKLSSEAQDFCAKALTRDPTQRPSAQ